MGRRLLAALLVALPSVALAGEVWVVARPWTASFSPQELASALRLRLPGTAVLVVDRRDTGASPCVELVGAEPVRVRLVRGRDVLLDEPLPEGDGGPRRAALFAAIALETAPEPRAPEPVAIAVTPAAEPPSRWAISASLGPALAVDDDTTAVAPALLVRARRFVGAGASVELGGKLSGAYTARSGDTKVSFVDRAAWLGAAYRFGTPSLVAQLGLAVQVTDPAIDVEGVAGEATTPVASRFGARFSADVAWLLRRHVALVVGVAGTFNLDDREVIAGGMELLGLGPASLDVSVGPEVRW